MASTNYLLPKGPRAPRLTQGAMLLTKRATYFRDLRDSLGPDFMFNMPMLGNVIVVSDPESVREVFLNNEQFGYIQPNPLGRLFGSGSMVSMVGKEHRTRRKLLTPPFNGRRLDAYRDLVEEEALREMNDWVEGEEFPVVGSMMRMTARIILRAVFGADGRDLERLRELCVDTIALGSTLAVVPIPEWELRGLAPWGRFRRMRAAVDAELFELIAKAKSDPNLETRTDILAAMVQVRDEDGTGMSDQDIVDELSFLLAAGHETTANTLAWAVERLRRHPDVLARLVDEVDAGGSEFRDATIWEIQRTRPVVDIAPRHALVDGVRLGKWVLPKGQRVVVSMTLMHTDPELYPDPDRFDPDRFLGKKPDLYTWIPFGGGVRRCIGAAFSQLEMDIVLRVLLEQFTLLPTSAPDEKWAARGFAAAPTAGGVAQVRRRHRGPAAAPEVLGETPTGQGCPITGAGG